MVTSLRSKWAVGKAREGRISESIRNRRATRPPAHFQRYPPGRGQLAVFPCCSLDPYDSDMGASLAPCRRPILNATTSRLFARRCTRATFQSNDFPMSLTDHFRSLRTSIDWHRLGFLSTRRAAAGRGRDRENAALKGLEEISTFSSLEEFPKLAQALLVENCVAEA